MKKLKYLLLILPFLFINSVNADNISSFSNRFYWCRTDGANDESCNWTSYHSNSEGYSLELYGTENDMPTYTYFEYLSGFQTQVSRTFKKGVSYTFTINFSFSSLADDEFKSSSFSRWSNLSYAYSSNGVVTSASSNYVKGSCNKFSGTDYCSYYGTATYTIVPSSDLSSITIGSYVSSGASYGFYKHYLTSAVVISSLDIVTNSDDTIVNQNQTIINQNQTIINQNQTMIDKSNQQIEEQQKTNKTLTDDTIDTSKTDIEDKSADASNSPISSLLTLPLKLLNNINTGLSGTCSAFNLGSFFGTDLILPCINLEQRLGAFLWGLIDSFFCIFLIYNVGMLAIKIWTDVIMMKDFFSDLYKPSGEKGGKKD